MRTVRAKLAAIVAVCVLPAAAAALLRAREAHLELLQEVHTRMDSVDEAFISDTSDDLAAQALAIRLAARDERLMSALSADGPEEALQVAKTLASVYADSIIVLARTDGAVVAATQPGRAPKSLSVHDVPQMATLWTSRSFVGMVPLPLAGVPVQALVAAEPVQAYGQQVGALALITPVDPTFLAHEKLQLGSNWALRVNGALVSANPGNPDPSLQVLADVQGNGIVAFAEEGDRFYAFNTFRPPIMQTAGQVAIVTASRDVTDLRDAIRRGFRRSLAILGGALLLALALAMVIAGGMLDTVARIARAATSLKMGKYSSVEGVRSRDELGDLSNTFNQMVEGLRERDRIKETFGKYVSRQVAEHVLQSKGLGGESVRVTVLFSDIRGFTTISEKMEPKAVLDFLNVYFTGMVEAVMHHQGVVDKFIGDAIMAVYGAPEPHPDDAFRAVSSALSMRTRLKDLNDTFRAQGLPEIRAGIGLHTGTVVAGNMGHTERREYTVIGDSVNLASRLESMTKEFHVDILLSEDTYEQVKDRIDAEPLKRITVKGRQQDVMVYRLIGLKGEAARAA
jgi:adenylate cyclase